MEQLLARLMQMDEATWRRHASPWSVWTRVATLPAVVLAVWSRVWLGWWSLLPITLLAVWLWWNPRAFPPPRNRSNWGSKATFGERAWLGRKDTPIPRHHAIAARLLSLITLAGALVLIIGLVRLHIWLTLLGVLITMLGKLWFCDRMVWLYDDMQEHQPPVPKLPNGDDVESSRA